MHPTISQKRAILEGLRERTSLATAEFYQKAGVIALPLAPRIIVKPIGGNNFEIIERASGKIITQRFGHNNATSHARELEAESPRFSIKQFGRILRDWAMRISVMLVLFAFFGSHV